MEDECVAGDEEGRRRERGRQVLHNELHARPRPPPPPPPSQQQQQQKDARPTPRGWVSFYLDQPSGPVPVQLPPDSVACADPPAGRPGWRRDRYISPSFLRAYGAPLGGAHNVISFLGKQEHHSGKFLIPPGRQDAFLDAYWEAAVAGRRRLFLAQCYRGQPYKYVCVCVCVL